MSTRSLLEVAHREAAELAGNISLLLTREKITKRDVLGVVLRIGRIRNLNEKLRAATGLPPEKSE